MSVLRERTVDVLLQVSKKSHNSQTRDKSMETRHKETKVLYLYFTKRNQFLSEVQFSFVNIPSVARLSVSEFL